MMKNLPSVISGGVFFVCMGWNNWIFCYKIHVCFEINGAYGILYCEIKCRRYGYG